MNLQAFPSSFPLSSEVKKFSGSGLDPQQQNHMSKDLRQTLDHEKIEKCLLQCDSSLKEAASDTQCELPNQENRLTGNSKHKGRKELGMEAGVMHVISSDGTCNDFEMNLGSEDQDASLFPVIHCSLQNLDKNARKKGSTCNSASMTGTTCGSQDPFRELSSSAKVPSSSSATCLLHEENLLSTVIEEEGILSSDSASSLEEFIKHETECGCNGQAVGNLNPHPNDVKVGSSASIAITTPAASPAASASGSISTSRASLETGRPAVASACYSQSEQVSGLSCNESNGPTLHADGVSKETLLLLEPIEAEGNINNNTNDNKSINPCETGVFDCVQHTVSTTAREKEEIFFHFHDECEQEKHHHQYGNTLDLREDGKSQPELASNKERQEEVKRMTIATTDADDTPDGRIGAILPQVPGRNICNSKQETSAPAVLFTRENLLSEIENYSKGRLKKPSSFTPSGIITKTCHQQPETLMHTCSSSPQQFSHVDGVNASEAAEHQFTFDEQKSASDLTHHFIPPEAKSSFMMRSPLPDADVVTTLCFETIEVRDDEDASDSGNSSDKSNSNTGPSSPNAKIKPELMNSNKVPLISPSREKAQKRLTNQMSASNQNLENIGQNCLFGKRSASIKDLRNLSNKNDTELRIVKEIIDLKQREEELKQMRQELMRIKSKQEKTSCNDVGGGTSCSEVSSVEIDGRCSPSNSEISTTESTSGRISVDSFDSGSNSSAGRNDNMGKKTSIRSMKPYEEVIKDQSSYKKTASAQHESPIEKEIRLAKQREEELRKEKEQLVQKIKSAMDTNAMMQASSGAVVDSKGTSMSYRDQRHKACPSSNRPTNECVNEPAALSSSHTFQKILAKTRIQQEIEEQTQREIALKESGSIKTISQERIDPKIVKSNFHSLSSSNSISSTNNNTNTNSNTSNNTNTNNNQIMSVTKTIGARVRRGAVSTETKIQEELREMRQREQELR